MRRRRREGGVARRADASVHNDWDGGLLDNDLDLGPGLEASVAADGRTERHHGRGADILQAAGENRVGVDVGKNNEALLHEDFGGGEGFDGIGQEVVGVGVDLEFHPFRKPGRGGEAGEADGLVGIHCATGVRQKEVFFGIDEIEDVRERVFFSREVGAAEGDCNYLASARREGVAHDFVRGELSGSEKEARGKGAPGDGEWLWHGQVYLTTSSIVVMPS